MLEFVAVSLFVTLAFALAIAARATPPPTEQLRAPVRIRQDRRQ